MLAVGGAPVKEQLNDLQKGVTQNKLAMKILGSNLSRSLSFCFVCLQVDIVVGTPGRVEELAKNGNLLLDHCRFFVLDEADGLLQQGHGEMIKRLHGRIPKFTSDKKRLQMIVCSATLHSLDVQKMAVRKLCFILSCR